MNMIVCNALLQIFLYLLVVCSLSEVFGLHEKPKRYLTLQNTDQSERREPPCTTCPRQGRCVRRIQCPALLRPGSYNPECHLHENDVGVCCFTGHKHAAEIDHKARASSSISAEDEKLVQSNAENKLNNWWSESESLLKTSPDAVCNSSSPCYGHHLSMIIYDHRVEQLGRGGLLNLFATQELKARQVFSDDELHLGLSGHTDGPFCPTPPACPATRSSYRSIDGECNNEASSKWGAVFTPFERILPPDYSDGVWEIRTSLTGVPLPSPRVVSSRMLLDANHPSPTHNMMFMQFGQFIAHDISSGVLFTIGNNSAISCCSHDGAPLPPELQHWACAPVLMDKDDRFYRQFGATCHNFVRTQISPNTDCSLGYAKQMNGATHYLDLSHIYGMTAEKVAKLRDQRGLLKTFRDFGRDLPPLTDKKECISDKDNSACFESGDNHVNQIISLTALHTIWIREHNRVAKGLARLNPDWSEDKLYMETRRILQAEYQFIVYNEWLPLLIGFQLAQSFGLTPSSGYSSSYDRHVNPSLTAEFSAAAMRFGHSVVDGKIMIPNMRTGEVYETISISELMFQPSRMRLKPFLDRILLGLTFQPMQNVDPFVTEGLTRYMFHGGKPFGLDLASINIQRGRDYGLRSYNHYRRLLGLESITNFKQFSPNAAQRLSSVYASPEDIDLWIGGLLEKPVEGGIVGEIFANIIGDQFSRLKRGDRYYFEHGPDVNPGAFTPSQLAEIKKVTMARIICDNRDGIELSMLAPSVFLRADLPGTANELTVHLVLGDFRRPWTPDTLEEFQERSGGVRESSDATTRP